VVPETKNVRVVDPVADRVVADLAYNIRATATPESPPVYTRAGAEFGYSFLASALTMRHVLRETEHIRITNRDSLSRSVSLDVGFDRLSRSAADAGRRYGEARHRTLAENGVSTPGLLWVPVARIDRRVTSPLDIRDGDGSLVPRATQPEMLAVLNAAIYQLLVTLLERRRDQSLEGNRIESFLRDPDNRPRWLFEEAVARLIFDGPPASDKPAGPRLPADDDAARDIALDVLRFLATPYGQPFLQLLFAVSRSYVVVAGLPLDRAEHRLTYAAPDLRATDNRSFGLLRLAGSWILNDEFAFTYERRFPSNVRSYHLVLETDEEVHVRRGLLRDARQQRIATALERDLREIATTLTGNDQRDSNMGSAEVGDSNADDNPGADAALRPVGVDYKPLLQYEVQRELLRFKEVIAQRQTERVGLQTNLEDAGVLAKPKPGPLVDTDEKLDELIAQAGRHDWDRVECASKITEIADRLEELDIGFGATISDDARDNHGHIYWRVSRAWAGSTPAPSAFKMTFTGVLADDRPSLKGQVVLVLAGLLLLVGFSSFALRGYEALFGYLPDVLRRFDPPAGAKLTNPDALVAVLLIGPAFMLTRLEAPRRNSVLSYLRRPAQAAAYLGVSAMAYLAVNISLQEDVTRLDDEFQQVAAFLTGLLLFMVAQWGVGMWKRGSARLRRAGAPRWQLTSWRTKRLLAFRDSEPEARFVAIELVGSDSEFVDDVV